MRARHQRRSVAHTVGTVGVYYLDNNGNRVYLDEDVTLAYTTQTDANNNTHGVLKVIRQDGFADLGLTIELSGGAAGLTDPLPVADGFQETLFNVGHEW